ncbi:MAG: cbb3-type cytochrome c oxidase subunit I [Gammaproteobacteria bacterium]|nr:cbb3-type cytochrome c oxidase subunit I [Gammaproteobacteria bacterium]
MSNTEIGSEDGRLMKFLVTSVAFFMVGTVHGVLQVQKPIRAWLDSIGSPYGGPGHMIDPLAHAHINVIGGVVILLMAVSYYLLPRISKRPLYSYRLVEHTYWWTTIGLIGFYSTLLLFGYWEGSLLLEGKTQEMHDVHSIYRPVIAVVSTVMGVGFWIWFANIFITYRHVRK